jgi:aminoglycoside phosphotransferase (APT) family kinase protein
MDLHDTDLPEARHLFGGRARELLSVAIEGAGGRLRRLTSEQALYRPGHDLVVRYEALVDWGDGRPVGETLIAGAAVNGAPAGTMVLQADDLEVAVWRYPFDPDLPGLAKAVTPSQAAELVGDIVGNTGIGSDHVGLEVRTFRPRRRAAVEATGPAGRAFLKVVRPSEVAGLVAAHNALAAAGLPVPGVLRVEPDLGIVVISAVEGDTLRAALANRNLDGAAAELAGMLDRLGRVEWPDAPAATPGPLVHAPGHALLLEQVVPSERDRLHRLLDRIGPAPSDSQEQPAGIVHGDLHEAQVLMAPDGAISGLIDLDDAGRGNRADDVANLSAHLLSFALGRTAPVRRRVDTLVSELARAQAQHTSPVELERRIGAAMVAMATGPFRARQSGWRKATAARLALAEQRLDAHERSLRVAS